MTPKPICTAVMCYCGKHNLPRPPEGKHTNFCHWKAKSEALEAMNARLVAALEMFHAYKPEDAGRNYCDICDLLREAAK